MSDSKLREYTNFGSYTILTKNSFLSLFEFKIHKLFLNQIKLTLSSLVLNANNIYPKIGCLVTFHYIKDSSWYENHGKNL